MSDTRIVLPPLKWRSSPNFSERRSPVRIVTVHRPVGSYDSAIRTLCNPAREASAHAVVREDGREATQLVEWSKKAWHCEAYNSASDGIETPDHIWLEPMTASRLHVMAVCARIVAFRLHKRNLPAVWLHGGALISGHGFTRHYDLGAAGGGHTNPTLDLHRWGLFVAMVQHELARGEFRQTWGRT